MKMYMVGGACRDEILGVPSKDYDYTVVLEPADLPRETFHDEPFHIMVYKLTKMGFKIFKEDPQFFTARAQFPRDSDNKGLTADFVLARKERGYADGRRPDSVEVGTLYDDLARRDFSMNAIAKKICSLCEGSGTANIGVPSVCGACDGTGMFYIDPFHGRRDIADKLIVTVGDPVERFLEDALRVVRALRFSVTKGFRIDTRTAFAMENREVLDAFSNNIAIDRVRVEVNTMFAFDTIASLNALMDFPLLTQRIFGGTGLKLQSTLKEL